MDCPKEVCFGCFYNANLVFKNFTFLFSNIFKTGNTTWFIAKHENMIMFSWQEYHCLSYLFVCCMACGILVSLTRGWTHCAPSGLEVWSLNPWTAREVPSFVLLVSEFNRKSFWIESQWLLKKLKLSILS